MPPLFDTHCHYNLDPIYPNWSAALTRALTNDITGAVVIGTSLEMSRRALDLKNHYPDYFRASLGLHPEQVMTPTIDSKLPPTLLSRAELTKLTANWQEFFSQHTLQADAFGECGLDFFYDNKTAPTFPAIQAAQENLLSLQLTLAAPTGKPIILHVRDHDCDLNSAHNAYGRLLSLVKKHAPDSPLIFHCFSGTPEYLHEVLTFPHAFISFAGNLTFKNAANLRALLPLVPPTRLLLETDAPFLSPEPKRGQPCEPWFLTFTAQTTQTLGFLLPQIYQNSLKLFGKNKL